MYIDIRLCEIGIGIFLRPQEDKISGKPILIDQLLQFIPQISFPKHIPAYIAFLLLQQFHGCDRYFICLLCRKPSHGQKPCTGKSIGKSALLQCLLTNLLPVEQVMENLCFLLTFRINLKKTVLYFPRYGKDPVKVRVAVPVKLSGITRPGIIHMKKYRLFFCIYIVPDIICRTSLQICHRQIVLFRCSPRTVCHDFP